MWAPREKLSTTDWLHTHSTDNSMLENSEATSTEYLSNEFRAGNLHLVRFLSVYKKATENIFEHAKTTGIYDPCELLNKQFDNESNPPTHESKKKKIYK